MTTKKTFFLLFMGFSTFVNALFAQTGGGCAQAIAIQTGSFRCDSMIEGAATFSGIEPFPTKAKWYKFTPTQDGVVTISACNAGADTRVFLFQGNCNTLTLFGFNDDYCADGLGDMYASDIARFVKANQTYYIEWDNAWDDTPFNFTVTFSTATPGPLKTCATAQAITPGFIGVDSLVGYASHGNAGRANWYKFTPTRNGRMGISSCDFDIDTRLFVYTGNCNSLTEIATGDDDCGTDTLAAAVNNVAVTAGTTYYIEWDDAWESDGFEFTLTFDAATSTQTSALATTTIVGLAPNPADDYLALNLDFIENTAFNMVLRNAIGQAVWQKSSGAVQEYKTEISTKDLESGFYILEVQAKSGKLYKKVLIQH